MNILILTVNGIWHSVVRKSPVAGSFTESRDKEKFFRSAAGTQIDEMGLGFLFNTWKWARATTSWIPFLVSVIHSKTNNIIYSDEATITELDEYLSKQRSPDVIMIDSIQYFEQQGGAKSPRNNPPAQEVSAKRYLSSSLMWTDARWKEKTAYDVKTWQL